MSSGRIQGDLRSSTGPSISGKGRGNPDTEDNSSPPLLLPGGMAIVIDMFIIVGALPEADIVDDQFQIALHRLSDGLEGLEFPVDVFIDDDLLNAHVLILKGLPHRVDPGCGGDLDLQTGKAFSHQIDEVRNADGDRVGTGFDRSIPEARSTVRSLFSNTGGFRGMGH